ncbi:MAG: hypothetical protein P1U57_15155, partial [Oleibacter sp.]|nr:hypothetical protein [Thalassolituus sp.]
MGLSYRRGRRGASKFPKTTLARFLTLVISGCGLSNIVFAEQCTKAHFLKSEIDSEQYIKAMELAESCREETEGDVLFDYNYGRAAYLVQQYDKAVFAIERVIANEPNNYQAHMLLGAIYSKMGNVKAAAYEWTYVKANAQDPDTIAHAETLLKTFSDESFEQYWQASLEVGFGFDDNLNLGIDRDSINLNGVDVEIVDERREQDSFFNDVAAEGTYLFSKNNAVNLRFWHRGYYDGQQQTEFTLRNIYTASELRFPITLSAELRPLLIDGEFARLV